MRQSRDAEVENLPKLSSEINSQLPYFLALSSHAGTIHVDFEYNLNLDQINLLYSIIDNFEDEPDLEEYVSEVASNADLFGHQTEQIFKQENIAMGITQVGKSKEVADFTERLGFYLSKGVLTAAITEIDSLIANGLPQDLEPFISEDRLLNVKTKIVNYMSGE